MPFSRRGSKGQYSSLLRQRVPGTVTFRAVRDFLESIDSPRSLTVWLLFREGEHQQLADLEVDINLYKTQDDAYDAYLATEFLSKFKDLSLEVDKKDAAILKFEKFEDQCRQTNKRFRVWRSQGWKNPEIGPLLSAMAFKIDTILGPLNVQEIFDSCDWGPGATTLIKSRDANSPHKFQHEVGITRRLYDLLCPFGRNDIIEGYSPRWCQRLLEQGFPVFQAGNKVVTVPKSSKIDRVIAIEPGFNLWFQKGVGAVMKRRLRKWRIDLTDQSRNQELARTSSLDGDLATIDFSSASDSISYELVKELFPALWGELLDRLRSERGTLGSKVYTWEKFSSMGNGYTFEVESLIFYALAKAVADQEGIHNPTISVYGDDVIIPVSIIKPFSRAAELLGFSINMSKSYASGPFRESCGAHWYRGSDFKPVYLKSKLNTVQSVFRHANAVRRLSHRAILGACDQRFRAAFYHLVYSVPKPLRFWIPETLGDGGFIGNFDEATPKRAKHQIEGFNVKHVVDISISTEIDYDGLFLSRLRAAEAFKDSPLSKLSRVKPIQFKEALINLKLSDRSSRNSVTTRDRTRPVVMTSLVPLWYNLGPWL